MLINPNCHNLFLSYFALSFNKALVLSIQLLDSYKDNTHHRSSVNQHEDISNDNSSTQYYTDKNPSSPGLIFMVTLLSVILFFLIATLFLPIHTQNKIFRFCLHEVEQQYSYIDVALYKARHSMYRKEIYLKEMTRQSGAGVKTNTSVASTPSNIPSSASVDDSKVILEETSEQKELSPVDSGDIKCPALETISETESDVKLKQSSMLSKSIKCKKLRRESQVNMSSDDDAIIEDTPSVKV